MKQPTNIEKILVPIVAIAIITIAFFYGRNDVNSTP